MFHLSSRIVRCRVPSHLTRYASSSKNFIIPGEESKLQELVVAAGKKVLYFTATWCPPCKAIAPVFEKLSGQHPNTTFLKIDIDQFSDAAAEYNIRSVPTFIFVNGRTILSQVSNFSCKCHLLSYISFSFLGRVREYYERICRS